MERTERFVGQLTEHQTRLFGYVYSLVGDRSRAADVVQETNLVLWRKIDEFDPEKPFLPWAFSIARFQVLAHLRDLKRDKVLIDAELAATLSDEAQQQAEEIDRFRDALRPCLSQLSPANLELVQQRYFRGLSVTDVSQLMGRSISSVKVNLLRVRRQLGDCVQRRLATAED